MNMPIQAATSELEGSACWNQQLGQSWMRVLQTQQFDPRGTFVEIGPGFSDKIAIGLAALGFRGRIILIEPNEAACRWAVEKYRRLLPRAEVIGSLNPIPDSATLQGCRIDGVLSNHVFDDLLFNAAASRTLGPQLFSEMLPDAPCSPLFIRSWERLLAVPQRSSTLVTRVVEDFMQYIDALQPRFIVANEYLSWRHGQCGLEAIHMYGLRMFRAVQQRMGSQCIAYTDRIGSEQQGVVYWLIR
jgi:hypothetical protein